MRPLWMLEQDIDFRDALRQRYGFWPDVIAVAAAALIIAGATAAAIWLW